MRTRLADVESVVALISFDEICSRFIHAAREQPLNRAPQVDEGVFAEDHFLQQ
jgi:hypothetical protein